MKKLDKLEDYEDMLSEMVCRRRNVSEVEPWLVGQIHTAAMNLQMLDKIHGELMASSLTEECMTGMKPHPLIPMFKDLQRSMILGYKALGLNFEAAPKRMTESGAKDGHDGSDPLLAFVD